jgi:hypothetical protein
VLTVEADPALVEQRLAAGELCCPSCEGSLSPWGWAAARALRSAGTSVVRVRPRRAVCPRCQVTHVLLPVIALSRRADLVELIGAALAAKAAGSGVRTIAGRLGRPVSTVRGWVRRFAGRAGAVRRVFTVLLVDIGPDPQVPAATGCPFADAVAAVVGAAAAIVSRWPLVGAVPVWQAACAASGGRLLAPSWP